MTISACRCPGYPTPRDRRSLGIGPISPRVFPTFRGVTSHGLIERSAARGGCPEVRGISRESHLHRGVQERRCREGSSCSVDFTSGNCSGSLPADTAEVDGCRRAASADARRRTQSAHSFAIARGVSRLRSRTSTSLTTIVDLARPPGMKNSRRSLRSAPVTFSVTNDGDVKMNSSSETFSSSPA